MLKERVNWLSRYAVLWVRVMFDLPVVEKTDHRAAIKIRKILLDQGFAMTRISVHFRMVSGEDKRRALENKIWKNPPEFGSVQIVSIPYKQYENIKVFKKGNVRTLKKTDNFCCSNNMFVGTKNRKASTNNCFQSVNAYPV
jgi:CRISPR-associated protein Cas2